ncbi:conserved hypothetical protein, partial [Trichinella spiralis]|uniref:hypothetical protein n=1 Tax=Trichinella spiralis TaxID=6334 RepID=UPI0001EFDD01
TSSCETSPGLWHETATGWHDGDRPTPVVISVRRSAIPSALGHQVGNAWNGGSRHPSGRPRSVVSCSANRALALQDPPSLEKRPTRPDSSPEIHPRGNTGSRYRSLRQHSPSRTNGLDA